LVTPKAAAKFNKLATGGIFSQVIKRDNRGQH
jgi:hypothetical protein